LQRKRLLLILLAVLAISIPAFWLLNQNETVAQDFTLTDLNGNTFHLSDFKGKIVVLEFMAIWCGSCKQQILYYDEIWNEYENKVVLIIIDIDTRESEDTLRRFAEQFSHPNWIWARDTANLAKSYKITAIPKTVIIDQNGYIRYSHTGVMLPSTFKNIIDQLLD